MDVRKDPYPSLCLAPGRASVAGRGCLSRSAGTSPEPAPAPLITKLPIDTRVVVRGATTELDPDFYGPAPSVETGRVVLCGSVTAGIEFDDGTCVLGIPWAVVGADDQ